MNAFRIQRTRRLDPKLNIKAYDNPEWFTNIKVEYEEALSPFCHTGDMHYIDAFGDYYPCCWWADLETDTRWTPINIKDNTTENFKRHFMNFNQHLLEYNMCPSVCNEFCKKIKNNDKDMIAPNTQLNRSIIKL